MINIVNKDQGIGWLIFIICVVTAIAYIIALFIPGLESIRIWLIAAPFLIAFVTVLAIGCLDRLDHGNNTSSKTNRSDPRAIKSKEKPYPF